jgi:phosphoglycolate phosphatase
VIRLFVFDLDGTLVDSLRDLSDSANELLVSCGGAPLETAAVGRMVGEGAATLVARVFAAAGVPKPADALERFLAIYDTKLLNHTRAYEGIPDALATIAERASLAVLTNKPLIATRRILDGLNLSRFFQTGSVLGGDGPLARKPDPAALRTLCARANVLPTDTMLVGDSLIDWETAGNAGTGICLARYGFGFRGFPQDRLNGREHLVDSPAGLLTLV